MILNWFCFDWYPRFCGLWDFLIDCFSSLLSCLVRPEGSISPLMFLGQVCCRYHKHRSNAIYKNEDPINHGLLLKRKEWSPCMSKVEYNFEKRMLSYQDIWMYSKSWCMPTGLSGWWAYLFYVKFMF